MKYLLVVTVVLVAFWIWRNNRRQEQADAAQHRQRRQQAKTAAMPVRMVACAHCGTHLPETDAVSGAGGFYCNDDHRRRGARAA